jgi:hypothetical protein
MQRPALPAVADAERWADTTADDDVECSRAGNLAQDTLALHQAPGQLLTMNTTLPNRGLQPTR